MKHHIMPALSRLLALALAVLAGLALAKEGTYAWFAQSDTISNALKTADMRFAFQVDEVFSPPGIVRPGQEVEKAVHVKNTGDLPGYVRVLVLAEIISAEGTLLEAIPGVTFTLAGLDTTHWAQGGDGWYYYLHRLEPGQTTPPLFRGVALAAGLGPEYADAGMKIEIKMEASETMFEEGAYI